MTLRTFTEILADMLQKIVDRTPLTNLNVGSIIRTIVEIIVGVIAELYEFIGDTHKHAFLATATGNWLDFKAEEFGIFRKPGAITAGNVIFGREIAETINRPIAAGTIVSTLTDTSGNKYRYITQAPAVLESLQLEVSVPVLAEFLGAGYNVGADSIRELTVHIPGITFVRNTADWIISEGSDIESDETLRQRAFLAWEELAQGGTKGAYLSWALSVDGVTNAYVNDNFPRGQGTVDIFILGTGGIPSPALIAETQIVIDENKPICSDSQVFGPEVRNILLDVVITPRLFTDTEAIEAEIRQRMDAYFNPSGNPDYAWITPLGIGRDVIYNQLVEIVMSVPGIYDIHFNIPPDDIIIAAVEFPVLTSFIIDFDPATD